MIAFIDVANNYNKMKLSGIKLSEIIVNHDLTDKNKGLLHRVNNSFKRNTYCSVSNEDYYECRLPNVGFHGKDLSIVLRYLLYKQEMQIPDRNLLRRILVNIFDEELISSGSKKFVQFFKYECSEPLLYFLLKGSGIVRTGKYSYRVKPGITFGNAELIAGQQIDQVTFQSHYLLLTLGQQEFNQYFRPYFDKKYRQIEDHLCCIREDYLFKVPLMARLLFYNTIQHLQFNPPENIITAGQPATRIYFLCGNDLGSKSNVNAGCLGLLETIKNMPTYRQSIPCERRLILLSTASAAFRSYILNQVDSTLSARGQLLNLSNVSCISNQLNDSPQKKQKIVNFMLVKKVKLPLHRSRLKTEPAQNFQASFKFIKSSYLDQSLRNLKAQHSRQTSIVQNRFNRSMCSKTK